LQALDDILKQASAAIGSTASIADLEQAKARFLGKSGSLTELLKGLGKLSAEERPRAIATPSSRASSMRSSPPSRST
jgi:phenylalanyl-tRNA synthetase alpha chain